MKLEHEQIFKYLESIAETIPAPFYWGSLDAVFLGVNNKGINAISASNKTSVLGKDVYQLYQNDDIATALWEDIQANKNGEFLQKEHVVVNLITRDFLYFAATLSPLYDSSGKIFGVVGLSIDITAQKKAALIANGNPILEDEEQNKFRQISDMVNYNIKHHSINFLNKSSLIKHKYLDNSQITLTEHHYRLLSSLSQGKQPQDTLSTINKLTRSGMNLQKILSIINAQVHQKFKIIPDNKLIERAVLRKLANLL